MSPVNLFTIPPGLAFADDLARGVLKRHSHYDDPLSLSRVLILLPTRRAIRTMEEAFARVAPKGVSVLPRLRALGDFDDEPSPLDDPGGDVFALEFAKGLRPPLTSLQREMLLVRLILSWAAKQTAKQLRAGAGSPALALKLARELARLFDQALSEGLSWARLKDLVPEDFAQHWQVTLEFLNVLTEHWPALLEAKGVSDPTEHRIAALLKAAHEWERAPAPFPVIAAGSTGSMPATAALLHSIARMTTGAVVLPGLDTYLDDEAWENIGEGHPQFSMRLLLDRMGASRGDVQVWGDTVPRPDRARLISEALRPADTTPSWRDYVSHSTGAIHRGCQGLSRVSARTQAEEALVIACALREAIETPGRTAALVTFDRALARRVTAELRRWDITIDDSAGTPLSSTLIGRFLCLLVEAAADGFAPVPLLALIKHPFTLLGFSKRGEMRDCASRLERDVLRGLRPAAGLQGLRDACAEHPQALRLVERLDLAVGGWTKLFADGSQDLAALLPAHLDAAALAASSGDEALSDPFDDEAGRAAHDLFERLRAAVEGTQLRMNGMEYAAFIRTVMDAVPVRPQARLHPRLSILGPLEARLQYADLIVIGGLNEGVWPPATDPGPWLNRPMRRELSLGQPERRIGLSAHDFVQMACAPQVVMTRAEKDQGQPTVPSRWLTRLGILVGDTGAAVRLEDARLTGLARALTRAPGQVEPILPPAPHPPLAARPRRVFVTDVELWLRDPYAYYAKRILRLRPLDKLDELPGARDRGNVIHKALEAFVKQFPAELPDDEHAQAALEKLGRQAFGRLFERPGVQGFWWPRFVRIAQWYIQFERERRRKGLRIVPEETGSYRFRAPGGLFVLSAKADRLELTDSGALTVIDFKTGVVPTAKQVQTGFAPQLTLEAAIALHGGFDKLEVKSVDAFLYVQLKGGEQGGKVSACKLQDMTHEQAARDALAKFEAFVAQFDDPEQVYASKPHVLFEKRASDYDHLARVKEWLAEGEA